MSKFIFSVATLFFLATLSGYAESSSPVTQIVFSPNIHIKPEQINNLQNIDYILTAGKYAWAVDRANARVAFFNGSNWTDGQSISGITANMDIYPVYPVTGKFPFAWAISPASQQVAFFDGQKWSVSKSVLDILHIQKSNFVRTFLNTSGGVAFLTANVLNMQGDAELYYSTNDSSKNVGWTTPKSLPSGSIFSPNQEDAFSDDFPFLYVISSSGVGAGFQLYQIDRTGTQKIINIQGSEDGDISGGGVFVSDEKIWINYTDSNFNSIIAYGSLDGSSWNYTNNL